MGYRLPRLGDTLQGETIVNRNTVTVGDRKVIFTGTKSGVFLIVVQSIPCPWYFEVLESKEDVKASFHYEEIKKAWKKMAKKYRALYGKKQPATNPQIQLYSFLTASKVVLRYWVESIKTAGRRITQNDTSKSTFDFWANTFISATSTVSVWIDFNFGFFIPMEHDVFETSLPLYVYDPKIDCRKQWANDALKALQAV